jgi:hypothetical protein
MPKKIKPHLQFETLERYCENPRELIYFMDGYFGSFILHYENLRKDVNNTHVCDRCGAEMFTNMHMDEPEKNGIDICQKCGIELWEKEKNEKNSRH